MAHTSYLLLPDCLEGTYHTFSRNESDWTRKKTSHNFYPIKIETLSRPLSNVSCHVPVPAVAMRESVPCAFVVSSRVPCCVCVCCEKTAQDNRLLVLFLLCQVVANRIFLVSLLCPVCLLCDVSVVVSYRCDNIWAKNNYNNKYNKIMIEVNGKTC